MFRRMMIFRAAALRTNVCRNSVSVQALARTSSGETIAARTGAWSTRTFVAKASIDEATGNTNKRHRSNAEELIARTPVIEVDEPVALCDGGGGSLGHPIEFIKLDKRHPDVPVECKYCGLRYVMKPHH